MAKNTNVLTMAIYIAICTRDPKCSGARIFLVAMSKQPYLVFTLKRMKNHILHLVL